MRNGRPKGRSSKTYQRKLNKLKKWHEERLKGKNTSKIKPLEWYIERLKQPNQSR